MPLPLLTRRGDTLYYDTDRGAVMVLDRRRYPQTTEFVACRSVEEVAHAIEAMIVQGGPPLAYVGGYGLALAARIHRDWPIEALRGALLSAGERLRQTRPTADDLHAVIEQTLIVAERAIFAGDDVETTIAQFVKSVVDQGDRTSELCGRNAAALLEDGDTILTHCFAGAALNWMLYVAFEEQGKQIKLVCNETRPYLQGARLAAASGVEVGVPTTVITDNMAGYCFTRGMFSKYITAADRIALDGSAANKVGTYQYAVLAQRHNVPFYVLGYDGPDPATATGAEIPIEERNPDEVLAFNGVRVAAPGAQGYYPAFDVTPPELIAAIVTDRGVFPAAEIRRYHETADTQNVSAT
ncbi:MAG TPA: s-methyl-5-thioribose-1-phosphate isomerase [Herpetosiphonaceae bacterium]